MKNSTLNNKPMKESYILYIQNRSQLKLYLMNENLSSLHSILLFLLSSLRNYDNNFTLFIDIITQMITKINSLNNIQQIKYEQNDKIILSELITEYSDQIDIINESFDNIFSDQNINYFLFSNSKHNIIIFLFSVLSCFTFLSFSNSKVKNSKKEVYHILQKIRSKYICSDMNRILCPGCSLNCITQILNFINRFIPGKDESQRNENMNKIIEDVGKEKEEFTKKITMLTKKVNIIKEGIYSLELLINDEKIQKEKITKELNEIINKNDD